MHLVGHGIVAKFTGEGLTSSEAFDAEPGAAGYAEALDGFVGVVGAGRLEAAIAGEEKG